MGIIVIVSNGGKIVDDKLKLFILILMAFSLVKMIGIAFFGKSLGKQAKEDLAKLEQTKSESQEK